MNASARQRLRIAARVAEELQTAHPDAEVWLEGALACGYAHAVSDIDLRLLGDGPDLPRPDPWLVEDVRIDLQVSCPSEVDGLRALLGRFDIGRTELGLFRKVRKQLAELTAFRTALSYRDSQWFPVIHAEDREVYRAWAVADRAESVASLTEDLIGLVDDGLHASATIVWQRLGLVLISAECAAAGMPVLGDKWLPLMVQGPWAPAPTPNWTDETWSWFIPVQRRLIRVLLACHPVPGGPGEPTPPARSRFGSQEGWLPQYYPDGWFLRRADQRVPVTPQFLLGWSRRLETTTV
jgi:hypothetical protein